MVLPNRSEGARCAPGSLACGYAYDGNLHLRREPFTDSYDYDAFGNKINSTGSTPNNFLYRGEQFNPDLGLYYLRARYYNPLTGRFMSRDPEDGKLINPSTLHKYLYAGGDPVNAIDPTGRGAVFEELVKDVVSAAVITAAVVPFGVCILKELKAMGQVLSDPISEMRYLDNTNIGPTILACVLDFYRGVLDVPFLDIWKRLGL